MNTTAAAINRKIDAINRRSNPVSGFDLDMSGQRNGETRVFDSAYKVGKSDIDPGWFVWGKWGGSSSGVWKRIAWPEGPLRKWPKISRLVQPGFRTKAEAESAMREIESMYPPAKRNPTPKRAPYVLHKKPAKRFPRYTVEVLDGSQWWGRESMNSLDQARAEVLFLAGGGMEARVIDQKTGEDVTNEPRTVALLARKSNPAGGVLLGIGVDAGKDRNGNPRRGHLVVRVSEGRAGIERVGFVESGYSGDSDLRRQFGDIPTIESFDVSSAVFKSLMSGRGL
jgi:hypothetical protein